MAGCLCLTCLEILIDGIPYAEQSKRPVEGPKGCYLVNAVRNAFAAGPARQTAIYRVVLDGSVRFGLARIHIFSED